VNFSSDQKALLLWALHDVRARRKLDGRAGLDTMRRLDALYHYLTSAGGSEFDTAPEKLMADDLIDTEAAAELLACSTRWIREIRADLEGRKFAGRWLFPRQVVIEYVELKGADCDGNRVPRAGRGAVPPRAA
jgi:hypothetical protein